MIEIKVKTGTFAIMWIGFGNETWEIGFIYEKKSAAVKWYILLSMRNSN